MSDLKKLKSGKLKVGVLASGRGSNLQAILDNIDADTLDAEVTVVVSDQPGAFALERARSKGIAAEHVSLKGAGSKTAYEQVIVDILKNHEVELVVLAGYMKLVSKLLLENYPNRIMNIHPALLPAFPGAHGQRDAVEYGVRYSGCTVHFVDEGMDTGPIILQAVVSVLQEDDEDTLAQRILKEEHKIYSQAIQLYAEGKLQVEGRKVKIKGESQKQ